MNYFEPEVETLVRDIRAAHQHLTLLHQQQADQTQRITSLWQDLAELATELDTPLALPQIQPLPPSQLMPLELICAALSPEIQRALIQDFQHAIKPIPPLDALDRFMILSVGLLACVADFVWVGLPATRWVVSNEGGAIPVGLVSERLMKFSVQQNNSLSKLFKVPYDRSNTPNLKTGLHPGNHRLLSFGHDPSPLGFLYGMLDILSGGMTAVTREGQMFHVSGIPIAQEKMILAPLLWLGHLLSDVATPMGLPVPGMILTQLLQIPIQQDGSTIADLGNYMYLRGYDFRHYLAGGTVPGLIEMLIRLYAWLRPANTLSDAQATAWMLDPQAQQQDARLSALLFWTHAVAVAGNLGKIAIGTTSGNFFYAMLGVNLMEWQVFALRFWQYTAHRSRDILVAQLQHNRNQLNQAFTPEQINSKALYWLDYQDLEVTQVSLN